MMKNSFISNSRCFGMWRICFLAALLGAFLVFLPGGPAAALNNTDLAAPVISNITPSGWVNNSSPTISADYSDPGSGVNSATATISLDGGAPLTGCTATDTNISCPASGLSEGPHTIAVSVTDNNGNTSNGSGAFKVDTITPAVTYIGPNGNIYTTSTTLQINYHDYGSGINASSVKVYLGGILQSGCTMGNVVRNADGSIGYAITRCPVSGLTYGPKWVSVEIYDNAGNRTIGGDGFWVRDNQPPAVTYTGPTGWLSSGDVTVTGSFTDPQPTSGIASAGVALNGGAAQPCSVSGGDVSCALSGLADGHYEAVISVRDNDGNTGTASGSFDVDAIAPAVSNVAPSGIINTLDTTLSADYGDGGSGIDANSVSVTLDGAAVSGCTVDGSHVSCAVSGLAYGSHVMGGEVSDIAGNTSAIAGSFHINSAPVVTAAGDASADEGATVVNSGSVADVDGDTVTLAASAGTLTNNGDGTWLWSLATTDGPADSQTVTITADDGNGGTAAASFDLAVNNVAPQIGTLTGPVGPVGISGEITVGGDFHDDGAIDTHSALYDWGDGTDSAGSVNEAGGSGTISASHTYASAGVYIVNVTVTDNDGGSGVATYQYVVIYDPSVGFVTGGGWINSPAGSLSADPAMTGKATFGFNSKYQKGATVPTGQTEFQFKAGSLNFHSSSYQWLVVAGPKAQYKGEGTINGAGSYGFLLTATDGQITGGGGVDKFRIKIWDKVTGAVVYDNMMGATETDDPATVLGAGSIVIHK